MAIIYTYPTLSSVAPNDRLLLSKASDNATSQVTIDTLKDSLGVIDTITASSPIEVTLSNHSAALSLTTVPTDLGGTGLTTIGSAGQFLVVNQAGDGLEYIDETFIDGGGTTDYLPVFTDSDTLGNSIVYQSGDNLVIPQYIEHELDPGSKFGFNANDGFLVYLGGTGATERLQLQQDSFVLRVGDSTKISTNSTNASLWYEPNTQANASHITLTSTIDGALLKGETGVNPGRLRLYNSDNNAYIGLSGSKVQDNVNTYNLEMPPTVGLANQVLRLPSAPSVNNVLEWGDGLPDQSGQGGNFLKTDGTSASWAQASGSGTITGGGTIEEVAFYSGASAITGNPSVRIKNNTGILYVGDVDQDDAGEIHIENEEGNVGGKLRLYGAESDTTRNKYIILNASEESTASPYNLYFPPTAASAAGKVLKSEGANGKLVWGDDVSGTIGGTVSQNFIPFGTSLDTLDDSIIDQSLGTYKRQINISSPIENLNPGDTPKYPVLRLTSGARNTSWTQGDNLGSIEFYHDENSTPTNPHIGASIKSVASQLSDGRVATGSDLLFSTAKYGVSSPNDALLSMTLTELGELQMTQNGLDTDNDYRAGNISLQKTGELRFYATNFTGNDYYQIMGTSEGTMDIGDFQGNSRTIRIFADGNSQFEVETDTTTIKNDVELTLGDLLVNSGDVKTLSGDFVASPSGDFITSGGAFVGGDGQQARPTYTFNSVNTTGFFKSGTGDVGFTSLGTKQFDMTPDGLDFVDNKKIILEGTNSQTNEFISLLLKDFGNNSVPPSIKWQAFGSNKKFAEFYYGGPAGTLIGSITQAAGANPSATLYNTTSDYRLKENVVEMNGAIDRVKQLKPSRFNFKNSPEETVDGFLAHEVQEVVPLCVTGEKDAVDNNGDIIPQAMDASKLVPLLTGAIKELTARIEALEAK